MTTLGSVEAGADFPNLLKRVAAGEHFVIVENGRPVAKLVPAIAPDRAEVDATIAKLKALRRDMALDGLSWVELRDAGRR